MRERMVECIPGFYGQDLEVAYIFTHLHWQELKSQQRKLDIESLAVQPGA